MLLDLRKIPERCWKSMYSGSFPKFKNEFCELANISQRRLCIPLLEIHATVAFTREALHVEGVLLHELRYLSLSAVRSRKGSPKVANVMQNYGCSLFRPSNHGRFQRFPLSEYACKKRQPVELNATFCHIVSIFP